MAASFFVGYTLLCRVRDGTFIPGLKIIELIEEANMDRAQQFAVPICSCGEEQSYSVMAKGGEIGAPSRMTGTSSPGNSYSPMVPSSRCNIA